LRADRINAAAQQLGGDIMSSLGLERGSANRAAPLTFAFCTISTMVFGHAARAQDVAANSTGLEEVVVTAQRREENLQRAALAVSALDGDALTQASVTQAAQLTSLAPSIQVAPAASSFTQIYLRGIGTFAANAFAEQGVAFNLDGVYLSRPAAPSAMFYDLERIEVLKGPQGTLYGRNASGGALNVITAKPKLGELGGSLAAEFGNYSTVKTSGALNIPTGERTALRIAGQWVERDGYFNDGTDDEDTKAIRAHFLIDPANGFDVTLAADYAEVGGKGTGGTIVPLVDGDSRLGASDPRVLAEYVSRPPTPPVPQLLAADDSYQDNVFYGASATLNADVGFATLTVIPSYRKTELDFRS
jgi:iron complex outermembrane receptor protein